MALKKLYIWRLARFLRGNGKKMSAAQLAEHMNQNGFRITQDRKYQGGRGTLRLIAMTYKWVDETQSLGGEEAAPVALAFVKDDGSYAWKPKDEIPEGEE